MPTNFFLVFCRHTASPPITSGTHTGGMQPNGGPLGKKFARKSRNSWRVSGGGVGHMVTQSADWRTPRTKYQPSKIAFPVTFVELSFEPLETKLLELSVLSLIGSPRTLFEPLKNGKIALWLPRMGRFP